MLKLGGRLWLLEAIPLARGFVDTVRVCWSYLSPSLALRGTGAGTSSGNSAAVIRSMSPTVMSWMTLGITLVSARAGISVFLLCFLTCSFCFGFCLRWRSFLFCTSYTISLSRSLSGAEISKALICSYADLALLFFLCCCSWAATLVNVLLPRFLSFLLESPACSAKTGIFGPELFIVI